MITWGEEEGEGGVERGEQVEGWRGSGGRRKKSQRGCGEARPLKSVGVPPTTNLWPDWSPQKRVNCDKLNQRQKKA